MPRTQIAQSWEIELPETQHDGKHRKRVKCALCDGSGKIKISDDGNVVERPCGRCNGTGMVGG
ncbi:MAG: hypothetical protein HOV68_30465 [Streptomycetaceae bacterium]|nr:hypothetical protein [Streptomycetaceae bacterium]